MKGPKKRKEEIRSFAVDLPEILCRSFAVDQGGWKRQSERGPVPDKPLRAAVLDNRDSRLAALHTLHLLCHLSLRGGAAAQHDPLLFLTALLFLVFDGRHTDQSIRGTPLDPAARL